MNKKERIISPLAIVSLFVFVLVMLLYSFASTSFALADTMNEGISQRFRALMASLGELFPFSLFEILVFSLPLIIFLVICGGFIV